MSIVTDMFLLTCTSFDPDDGEIDARTLSRIDEWLVEHARGQQFRRLDRNYDAYGGHKALQASVWCGAFNQIDVWAFIEFVRTLHFGGWAQVLYQGEFDDGFTLVQIEHADPFDDDPSEERAARRYRDLADELESCGRCTDEPAWLVRWSVDWRLDPSEEEWGRAVQRQYCRSHGSQNVHVLVGNHVSLVTAMQYPAVGTELELSPPGQLTGGCPASMFAKTACPRPVTWWITWVDGDARQPGRFDLPGTSAGLCSDHASTHVEYLVRQGVAAVGARRLLTPRLPAG